MLTAELFNHVDAERIVAGLLLASDWLSIVQADPLFKIGLPFVEGITISETLDLGAAFSEFIDTRLLTSERNANFANFDQLADRLLTDWMFDPVAQTVTLPINRALLVDTFDAPITFPSAASSDSSMPLADLSTSAEATIAGVGRFDFDFVIDLSPEFADVPSDQTTTVADQISLSDTSIQWQLNTLDNSMTGSARYGIIGFDFTGGRLTGSPRLAASVTNPFDATSTATLTELFAAIGDVPALFANGITTSNVTELFLPSITIQGELFDVPANGSLLARQGFGNADDEMTLREFQIGTWAFRSSGS